MYILDGKYFVFIDYSMQNVMMKLLSIFGFQNLKYNSGFRGPPTGQLSRTFREFTIKLHCTTRIGNTPTFLHFDLHLDSAYAVHYVYIIIYSALIIFYDLLRPRGKD